MLRLLMIGVPVSILALLLMSHRLLYDQFSNL